MRRGQPMMQSITLSMENDMSVIFEAIGFTVVSILALFALGVALGVIQIDVD